MVSGKRALQEMDKLLKNCKKRVWLQEIHVGLQQLTAKEEKVRKNALQPIGSKGRGVPGDP